MSARNRPDAYARCYGSPGVGEVHFYGSGPTCQCGKRPVVVEPEQLERPQLRVIQGGGEEVGDAS